MTFLLLSDGIMALSGGDHAVLHVGGDFGVRLEVGNLRLDVGGLIVDDGGVSEADSGKGRVPFHHVGEARGLHVGLEVLAGRILVDEILEVVIGLEIGCLVFLGRQEVDVQGLPGDFRGDLHRLDHRDVADAEIVGRAAVVFGGIGIGCGEVDLRIVLDRRGVARR